LFLPTDLPLKERDAKRTRVCRKRNTSFFCSANPWYPAGYGGIDGAESHILRGGRRMTTRFFGIFCADNKVVGSGHIFCCGLGRIRVRERVSPRPGRPPALRENRKPLPQFKAVAWPDRIRQPSAVPPMIAWFAQHGHPHRDTAYPCVPRSGLKLPCKQH
ncbi:uncharacterized protein P884DRAFT_321057, partial [Thermothelomyces heterothallicus CBS 202.75]|uniref:uncharacterized protein n=1 Tax=Thermothelomyces heterothallicus CBS 202.75 TaxID=1149848 RepID=UPI0037426F9A